MGQPVHGHSALALEHSRPAHIRFHDRGVFRNAVAIGAPSGSHVVDARLDGESGCDSVRASLLVHTQHFQLAKIITCALSCCRRFGRSPDGGISYSREQKYEYELRFMSEM